MAEIRGDNFYLGKVFDIKLGKLGEQQVLYDPTDLTTHAVITGMTGSGKTGLGVVMLEEAAMKGIPAIIIDPKGDLTNLMLHFPNLAPQDFEPWIDLDAAGNKGKQAAVLAQETASRWENGLKEWGLGKPDILNLQKAMDYTIYTPGSTAGVPVNILTSFDAPDIPWAENSEVLREKIASTVTALLGLVGLQDIDPLRSREHILLANLLEQAWSQAQPLTLADLIMQVQKPPFDRLGAFPVDKFFPEKDRMELAMLLNNFLASPSFQVWQQGNPLDVKTFLYTSSGAPRHSIFYLAHLSENERMFFVTLLFASIEIWMRAQRGTGNLRALIYMDEILGYLPPVANPPSRPVMLRMLKQARAFGVGLVLATQNPVDVDYKALSNAGTWLIGRLQTEQDKARLLDGLLSASGGSDRAEFDGMISGLQKRVFLLHNVHGKGALTFQTRWTLNYLAGPMTRAQISELNKAGGNKDQKPAVMPKTTTENSAAPGNVKSPLSTTSVKQLPREQNGASSSTRPALPSEIEEYFFPNDLGVSEAAVASNLGPLSEAQGISYHPVLFAQAEVRYYARQYGLNYATRIAASLEEMGSSLILWGEHRYRTIQPGDFQRTPLPQARFHPLPGWLADGKKISSVRRDFEDWLYREGAIRLRSNSVLKVFAGPQVSSAEFRQLCSEAAQKGAEAELQKIEATYGKKLETLQQKIHRQALDVKEHEEAVSSRRLEQFGSMGETVIGLLGGRKRSVSSTLGKMRMTQQSKQDLGQQQQILADLQVEYNGLEKAQKDTVSEVKDRWAELVNDTTEIPITPAKKDIFVEVFGVAWLPYYLVQIGGVPKEVPGFRRE